MSHPVFRKTDESYLSYIKGLKPIFKLKIDSPLQRIYDLQIVFKKGSLNFEKIQASLFKNSFPRCYFKISLVRFHEGHWEIN